MTLAGMVSPKGDTAMTNMNSLTDRELDQVSGAMDCKTALAVSTVYGSMASVLSAAGNPAASAYYSGMAMGVLQGGCEK
jgi:hypothetical protein